MQDYLIKTKRLGLRPIAKQDIYLLSKLESDPAVLPYFHPKSLLTRGEIAIKLNNFITYYETEKLPWLLIYKLDTNEYIGRIGFWRYKTGEIEFGFAFLKEFWGQGFATEVVAAILEWAKENIDSDDLIAVVAIDNKISACVLEKCGMQNYKIDIEEGEKYVFYRIKNR